MLDKWVGELIDGRAYADSQKKYESIAEEKLKAELVEMKLKIRTNPEEVEA